mgnify:CR=1 FL=1
MKREKKKVDGWVVLDKPVGLTSTQAVSRLKRIYNAQKAGHAGTLDPLASGILPVAFGEATKTVPFVQDGEKAYRFTARWGVETDSDDSDGKVTRTSAHRPSPDDIAAVCANASPRYYDIWALRHRTWCPSDCWQDCQLPSRMFFGSLL